MKPRESRLDTFMEAFIRTPGERHQVIVTNISVTGAGVCSSNMTLGVGQLVLLKPPGLNLLLGTVIWTNENSAGIKFEFPLHPAVVTHLSIIFSATPNEIELCVA